MTRARVLTFHVDTSELWGLTAALDGVRERFAQNPNFRGLVCLEHDSVRHQVLVITLWDGDGLEETEAESQRAQSQIAATSDLAVNCTYYEVLRLFPGSTAVDMGQLTPAFAS